MQKNLNFLKKAHFLLLFGIILTVSGVLIILISIFSRNGIFRLPSQSISRPAPIRFQTIQGVVTKVSKSSITVNSKQKITSFYINSSVQIQKVTSGSVAGGNAITTRASFKDIKEGQNVLIILERISGRVHGIYIL